MNEKQANDKARPGLVDDGSEGLTYKVIGLAMAVHNDLGPGHRESTYHNAMQQRFIDSDILAENEPDLPIFDENGNVINFYRPDHRVEQRLILEYKAHFHPLTNDDIAQCINYLAVADSDCKVVLLFNFGRRSLEWKRIFAPTKITDHQRQKWPRHKV